MAQIAFENLAPPPGLQAAIERHISELEQLYGRATVGRITVRGSGDRREPDSQYHVSIRLALPNGSEVDIGWRSEGGEQYTDLSSAVDDAFNRVRSHLREHENLIGSGRIASREAETVGTVVRIDPGRQFGFLKSATNQEIYFSSISILGAGAEIAVGARVSYIEELGEDGLQAIAVKVLGK
ncbi:HPF/RaiA family ribosome-associated protein [Bradyrhizobium sp. CB82]|uniref:HPF/RaiA family ribosome-associated protein n=1 Tax=Bradyrhizobium sp. CB82 TaxID=3039159 RepID=UPI0024B17C7C|nr:HPF/RaiA family ribosome-associated protein [Bradyrhizobium sp. CB82]WFU39706.1 HPF/RaiA family ribosome-associated protein [Bradyrhizobium sp. CB82]